MLSFRPSICRDRGASARSTCPVRCPWLAPPAYGPVTRSGTARIGSPVNATACRRIGFSRETRRRQSSGPVRVEVGAGSRTRPMAPVYGGQGGPGPAHLARTPATRGKQGRCRWEAARKSMISSSGMRGPFSRHLPLTRIANRCGARRTFSRRATVVVPVLSAGVALRIG